MSDLTISADGTSLVSTVPHAPKNLLAKSTASILNMVRWGVVGVFALGILFGGLVGLVNLTTGGTGGLFLGMAIVIASATCGAIAFAIIGWYVDSLALLTQIARNTHSS